RAPSAFGIELYTETEREAWATEVCRSMPRRSASEGSLLRYAQKSVEEMTSVVRTSLGVDVSTTTRRMIKKPSFVSRLDIGQVSSNPGDPSSATFQAVRKLVGDRSNRSDNGDGTLPAISAGQMSASRSAPKLSKR
ncbi:unnamed protein product, partial [Polarella glacialis]